MAPDRNRTYSTQEVNRIIQYALQREESEGIGHLELLEIGNELGLDAQTIEAAIRKEEADRQKRRALETWRKDRKFGFHWHLWSYIAGNSVLLLVNVLVPGPWWFQWSVIGWGIGLGFHFQGVYFPSRQQVQKIMENRIEPGLP